MMNIQELATSYQHNIPVLIILMNDHHLGMIRQLQDTFYDKKHVECSFPPNVEFVDTARSMGLDGIKVTDLKDVKEAIEMGLKSDKTFLIDCIITSQENIPYQSYDD